jgi:carbonic anhydrase
MSSDPIAADAVPEAARRRFNPKLLIMGGAAALLLLAATGGAAVWLWPKPATEAAEAKAARLAARRAAQAASAASAASATASSSAMAPPTAASSAMALAGEAGSAAAPVAPASGATAPLKVVASNTPAEPAPAAASASAPVTDGDEPLRVARTAAEAPLDKLQRRLGEVLGAKGSITPTGAGELRVHTRSAALAPVRHAETVAGTKPVNVHRDSEARPHGGVWSYAGAAGPQAWGRLKPEYSLCAKGQRQSPIDIRDGIALDLEPLQVDYKPSSFGVIDNGHTVQVNLAPGNAIELNGRRYALQQFHFHRPSELRINGRQFEMDVQLVHRDAEGRVAVLSVLLERGTALPALQTVWNHLPLEKNEENAVRVHVDPAQLLPSDGRYYTFMGSLTTPPCSEGVLWLVMQQPLQVSAQQIDIFARLYPMNARPIQSAAGRMIKQSN